MLSNLLFISNLIKQTKDLIVAIIFLILIVALIFVIIKFPVTRKLIGVILCFLVIFSGIFTCYASFRYFTANGGVFGSLKNVFIQNTINQDNLKFEFTNFNLVESRNKNEFEAEFKIKNNDYQLKDKIILVNNYPTELVYRGNSYISANFTYSFLDKNLVEVCEDTINISFSFSNKTMKNNETGEITYLDTSLCKLTSTGGLQKAKFWNKFLQKNNFIVEIKNEETIRDNEMVVEEPKEYTANLYYGNTLLQSVKFTCFKAPKFPDTVGEFQIITWKDIDGNEYTENTLPNKDIDLYAVVSVKNLKYRINKDVLTRCMTKVDNYATYSARFLIKPYILEDENLLDFYDSLFYSANVSFRANLEIKNFYGYDLTFNSENFGRVGSYHYTDPNYKTAYYRTSVEIDNTKITFKFILEKKVTDSEIKITPFIDILIGGPDEFVDEKFASIITAAENTNMDFSVVAEFKKIN